MVTMPAPTLLVNGTPATPEHVRLPATILHGRSGPTDQPDAPTLTVDWGDPATTPRIGDTLTWVANLPAVSTAPPAWDDPVAGWDDPAATWGGGWLAATTRFVGQVVDADVQETWPGPSAARLVAVGGQADLGRVRVVLNRPAESDVSRVGAIMAAAGVPITVHGTAGPMLAAAPELDTDALAALWDVCASSAGMVWQDTLGRIHYGTGTHRTDAPTAGILYGDSLLDGVRWQSTEADLINRVVLQYGPQDARGEHTVDDADSITTWGVHEVQVSTGLADQAAADQLGQLVMARRAQPYWLLQDVVVDTAHTDSIPAVVTAATLPLGATVLLPIPTSPGPVGTLAEWTVEGWAETWDTHDRMVLQLAVTDRARWADLRLRTWAHARTNTWAQETARGSWMDALILQPGETLEAAA